MSLSICIKEVGTKESAIRVALCSNYLSWKSDSLTLEQKGKERDYYDNLIALHKENCSLYEQGREIKDLKPYPDYIIASRRRGYFLVEIITS